MNGGILPLNLFPATLLRRPVKFPLTTNNAPWIQIEPSKHELWTVSLTIKPEM